MLDRTFRHRAVNSNSRASVGGCSHTRFSGASAHGGVVVARSGASADHRTSNRQEGLTIAAVSGPKRRRSGLRLAFRSSVACGEVTYNYAFERTGYRQRFALPAAAQRGR